MDGCPDPDCRRGMLCDDSRTNKELFQYYQTLIRIRHTYPALTEGEIVKQYVKDDSGLIYMERVLDEQRIVLIFHTQKGNVALQELQGMKNLVNGREFAGSLGGYEAAVLVK